MVELGAASDLGLAISGLCCVVDRCSPFVKCTYINASLTRQVLSGDTIVVMGQARGGPPPERTLSIAGITAPRLARRPGPKDKDSGADSKDEVRRAPHLSRS
jgi:endonuclease YncB( thermonuclease family)